MSVVAYIGLGSNLAGPAAQVNAAFEALAQLPGCVMKARSRLYRNPPMGPQDQPEYVNAVAALATRLPALDLFAALKAQESRQGRATGGERWGPRIIDLDLLLYGDHTIASDILTVPHAGIANRAFVLVPLAEIAPELSVPGAGAVRTLLEQVDTKSVIAMMPAATATV